MRCPECGETAADARLKYCEHCGGQMPVSQVATGSRPAVRASKPHRPPRSTGEPAYAAEILEEEAEVRSTGRVHAVRDARSAPEEDEHTDPGQSQPAYEGPRWLANVPGHSPSVLGVGLIALALVLSILPFFSGVGVPGTLLALVGGVLVVARELREAGERNGFTDAVPEVLLRPEVPAAYAVLVVALAVRMLGLGITPLLWVGGAWLVAWDQYRKVYEGPEGVGRYFEPRALLRMPSVVALGGVALCLLMMFGPWAVVSTRTAIPANAPVPGGPPELRVVDAPRPSDDVLYTAGAEIASLSGWDLSGSVLVELALLAVLALAALRPEVERPSWLRFGPAVAVGMGLLFALVNMRLALAPIAFVMGLGAVGFFAVKQAMDVAPAPAQEYAEDELPPEEE